MQPWPLNVQAAEQHLYYEENLDTYVFRNRSDGFYFVVGRRDGIEIKALCFMADLIYFCSQRMKDIPDEEVQRIRSEVRAS